MRQSLLSRLLVLLSFLPAHLYAQSPVTKDSLVGAWRLLTVETVRPNGESHTRWMGPHPTGLIIYSAAGVMSVEIMRDPRPVMKSPDFDTASSSEKAAAIDGYYAYFGTYDFDVKSQAVTHHVRASLQPGEVGLDYTRSVVLRGDTITLSTPLFDEEGEKRFNRLTWERVK